MDDLTIDDIGKEFGEMISQKIAELIALKAENKLLQKNLLDITNELNEAKEQIENYKRMTGK